MFPLADFAKSGSACDEGFAHGSDIGGVEDEFGAFGAGGWRAGVEREVDAAGGELLPAWFLADGFEVEDVGVERSHDVDLTGEEDDARELHGRSPACMDWSGGLIELPDGSVAEAARMALFSFAILACSCGRLGLGLADPGGVSGTEDGGEGKVEVGLGVGVSGVELRY